MEENKKQNEVKLLKENLYYCVDKKVYQFNINFLSGFWEVREVDKTVSTPENIKCVPVKEAVSLWGRIGNLYAQGFDRNTYYAYIKDYIKGTVCFKHNCYHAEVFNTYEEAMEYIGSNEPTKSECKLDNIILEDKVRRSILQCINFVNKAERYEAMGVKVPRGIMLYGEPGCGKTLIAKTIASECNVKFIQKSGSEFIEKYVGVGAKRIREMFDEARKEKSIIFIDEIDAIGAKRDSEANKESNATLNQLLVELDGYEENKDIFIIGATNRKDLLDPALLRPGRFTRHLEITLPDFQRRKEMFELYINKMIHEDGIDVDNLAQLTEGCSGAEIQNVVNEAGMYAVDLDRGEDILKEEDLLYIIDRDIKASSKMSRSKMIGFVTK